MRLNWRGFENEARVESVFYDAFIVVVNQISFYINIMHAYTHFN